MKTQQISIMEWIQKYSNHKFGVRNWIQLHETEDKKSLILGKTKQSLEQLDLVDWIENEKKKLDTKKDFLKGMEKSFIFATSPFFWTTYHPPSKLGKKYIISKRTSKSYFKVYQYTPQEDEKWLYHMKFDTMQEAENYCNRHAKL